MQCAEALSYFYKRGLAPYQSATGPEGAASPRTPGEILNLGMGE